MLMIHSPYFYHKCKECSGYLVKAWDESLEKGGIGDSARKKDKIDS